MSYCLKPGEPATESIRRIAREQLEKALEEMTKLSGAGDEHAVHRLRKSVKKLRALLRLVKPEIPAKVYEEENQRLRHVAGLFSDARDSAVQLQVVEELREKSDLAQEDFSEVTRLLRESRDRAAAGQRDVQQEATALLAAVHDRLEGWPLEKVTVAALTKAFGRTYRKGRQCFRHVLDHRAPETFHSWRKWTKNVWYQSQILQALNFTVLCQVADAADLLGQHLGQLHDLAFLREELEKMEKAPLQEREVIMTLLDAREQFLETTVLDLGRRFYAEKAGDFKRRLRRYATDWREN